MQQQTLNEQIREKMNESPEFKRKVMEYYKAMADNGNAEAQYQLGRNLIYYSESAGENYEIALDYLSKAAEQGHEEAEMLYLSETQPDDDGRYDAWS